MNKIEVRLAALGLCEGCEASVNMQQLPLDAMDAVWRCGNCNTELTSKSFGYEQDGTGKWNRSRWVGSDGKWTAEKPTQDFTLGRFLVCVGMPTI